MTKADNENQVAPPKRPLSAFFLYKSEKYPIITTEHPVMKIAEITQVISKQWQAESDEKKATYTASYQVAKAAFDQKMKDYISLYGKPVKKQKKIRKGKEGKAGKAEKKVKKEKKEKKPKNEKAKANLITRERTNGSADTKQSK